MKQLVISHIGFRMNTRSLLTCDGILILSEMFIFYHWKKHTTLEDKNSYTMTNQKKFYTSSHAVVHVNSYFIDFKIQIVVQFGKHGRKKSEIGKVNTWYIYNVLVYIIQLSGVSEYSNTVEANVFGDWISFVTFFNNI